ncbi:ribosomal protein, L4/L1 family [Ancylostoma caninum]|uniref:Large ribosomal subunit protein uL4m n=1 Tax=Ancylostoma caninum TaxID=29170 RepID=A0A368GFP7_ANCCA|nr:ribosomal protein, L4/L1 family [Ancylostoma caninum]
MNVVYGTAMLSRVLPSFTSISCRCAMGYSSAAGDVSIRSTDLNQAASSKNPSKVSKNPFVEVPQAWVSSFDAVEERKLGIIDLHPDIFRVSPRLDILHRNLTWQSVYRNVQLTKQLTRAEMPGGGRKPWPQKKTGRAHVGSIRSPQFIHGGFANGVRGPRTWFYILPDSIRLKGLCVALTLKHAQDCLHIVDRLDQLPADADGQFLHDLADHRNWGYSVLFVNDTDEIGGGLAAAIEQIPSFTAMPVYGLNCFSLMKYESVVFSRSALALLEERLLKQLNRAGPLNKKCRYADFKERILNEGEGEDHLEQPPIV